MRDNKNYDAFYKHAKKFLKDRIYIDYLHRFAHSIDASCYRYIPQIVIKAHSEEEIIALFHLSSRFNVSLTFRAAGTSLSGQACSDSVLVIATHKWEEINLVGAVLGHGLEKIDSNLAGGLRGLGRKNTESKTLREGSRGVGLENKKDSQNIDFNNENIAFIESRDSQKSKNVESNNADFMLSPSFLNDFCALNPAAHPDSIFSSPRPLTPPDSVKDPAAHPQGDAPAPRPESIQSITLQCGVIGADANEALKKYGKKIGPDPATINNAMIGGIFSNNSSGMCCGVRQNSYHTIKSVRVILQDGSILDTSDDSSFLAFCENHKNLIDGLMQIRAEILQDENLKSLISRKFAIKNTTGYSLNALLDFDTPKDILNHIFIGAEGTLGFISQVEYFVVDDMRFKAAALIFYKNLSDASRAVKILAKNDKIISAAEIMDYACLKAVSKLENMPSILSQVKQNHCCILVQLESNEMAELEKNIEFIKAELGEIDTLFGINFSFDAREQEGWWKIRKGLLPISASTRPLGSTVITEDICFEIEFFESGIENLSALFHKHGFEGIIFGHALSGNVHFIITPVLSDPVQRQSFATFMDEMVEMVVSLKGSTKAEHGTGRMMAPFIEQEWGEKAYKINVKIKNLFDSKRLINPDVIICEDKKVHLKNLKPANAIKDFLGDFIDKCMECGFCEKVCPSKNLTLTPRQRIAVYREMYRLESKMRASSNNANFGFLDSVILDSKNLDVAPSQNFSVSEARELDELKEGFKYYGVDTCATCSMCSMSCPLEIDTAHIASILNQNGVSQFSESIAGFVGNHLSSALKVARGGVGFINRFGGPRGDKPLGWAAGFFTKSGGVKGRGLETNGRGAGAYAQKNKEEDSANLKSMSLENKSEDSNLMSEVNECGLENIESKALRVRSWSVGLENKKENSSLAGGVREHTCEKTEFNSAAFIEYKNLDSQKNLITNITKKLNAIFKTPYIPPFMPSANYYKLESKCDFANLAGGLRGLWCKNRLGGVKGENLKGWAAGAYAQKKDNKESRGVGLEKTGGLRGLGLENIESNNLDSQNNTKNKNITNVIYFTSCLNRAFAPSKKMPNQKPLQEIFENICKKAGINVIYPQKIENLCCGKAFKDYKNAKNNLIQKTQTALLECIKEHNLPFDTPIVCDHSACSYALIEANQLGWAAGLFTESGGVKGAGLENIESKTLRSGSRGVGLENNSEDSNLSGGTQGLGCENTESKNLDSQNSPKLNIIEKLNIIDMPVFLESILDALKITPINEKIGIYHVCAVKKAKAESSLKNIAKVCVGGDKIGESGGEIFEHIHTKCCGFAGNKGFLTPELNESALEHFGKFFRDKNAKLSDCENLNDLDSKNYENMDKNENCENQDSKNRSASRLESKNENCENLDSKDSISLDSLHHKPRTPPKRFAFKTAPDLVENHVVYSQSKPIKMGFSSSSTCEIGLSTATGFAWQHIAYLLDMCSEEK